MKMKNFDEILTDCLKGKGLRYIRFKVDPTLNAGFKRVIVMKDLFFMN